MTDNDQYLTLSQAAAIAPGRPSVHSIWRWARKGVKARAGHKLYLDHVRIGGTIYTRKDWLFGFFRELAQADKAHFKDGDSKATLTPTHTDESSAPPEIPSGLSEAEDYLDNQKIT